MTFACSHAHNWHCLLKQRDILMVVPAGDTVVLDCGSQIFSRLGHASAPGQGQNSAEAESSTETLLGQLMHNRVPAPAVLRLHQVNKGCVSSCGVDSDVASLTQDAIG